MGNINKQADEKEVKIIKPQFNLKGEVSEDQNNTGEHLTPWPDVQFGIPNKLLRSAIFGIQREKRDGIFDQFSFVYQNDLEITFTGPRLNQDDSIVWQSILRAVKNSRSPLGAAILIKKIDVLNHLNKSNAGKNYNWLVSSLDKLSCSTLKCQNGKEVFSSNLIVGYRMGKSDTYFTAGVSSFLAPLLSEDLTDIDILRKSQLTSQLSRWLHDFYSSHTQPIPYSIDKLKNLCRSNQVYAKFKMSLKKSIEDLKNCEPPLFDQDSFLDVKTDILYAFKKTGSPYVPPSKYRDNLDEVVKHEELKIEDETQKLTKNIVFL